MTSVSSLLTESVVTEAVFIIDPGTHRPAGRIVGKPITNGEAVENGRAICSAGGDDRIAVVAADTYWAFRTTGGSNVVAADIAAEHGQVQVGAPMVATRFGPRETTVDGDSGL